MGCLTDCTLPTLTPLVRASSGIALLHARPYQPQARQDCRVVTADLRQYLRAATPLGHDRGWIEGSIPAGTPGLAVPFSGVRLTPASLSPYTV